jgi:DUF4097 and DUF4098 domain-containing protein YvlB
MLRYLTPMIAFTLIFSSLASAEYREKRTLTMESAGLKSFSIDVGAGDLKIRSQKNLDEIQVITRIVVNGFSTKKAKTFIKDHIKVDLTSSGSDARFVSEIDSNTSSWASRLFSGNTGAHVDIEIVVPENITLQINDRSGDIQLENIVQNVGLDDRSGDIRIKYMTGILNIGDASGDVTIDTFNGSVHIDDGSGDTTVRNAEGNVSIQDGSGDIRIEGVIGSVNIKEDGSGDIRITSVTENVTIGDSGSGDIHLAQVAGNVNR